jgi:hypothetical protein
MFRRLLGIIILLVSLITVAILLGGAYFTGQVVDAVGEGVGNVLALTVDSLGTVSATLEQTKATIVEANNAIETVSGLTSNLSRTVANTQPVMASMTTVVSEDIPNNIEAIQMAIPNVAGVAGVVDGAMTTLSNFGISQVIPIPFNPITLEFDLGIDYEPEEPFDETILALGDSLEGMPEELRSLQADLDVLSADLETVSDDILTSSENLVAINEQVALFIPLLDDYLGIVDQIGQTLVGSQAQILAQLETVKTIIIVALVFLALTQLAPLYIGWELVTGQRGRKEEETVEYEPAPVPPPVVEEKLPPPPVMEEEPEPLKEAVVEQMAEAPLEQPAEPLIDPVSETVIEGPYVDPGETVVEETLPAASPEKDEDQL